MKKAKTNYPKLPEGLQLIDTHCHLDMEIYRGDLDDVLSRANQHGVQSVVTIGIDLKSSEHATDLAIRNQQVYATIGVHPHDVDNLSNNEYDALRDLYSKRTKHIVGYGEIGLDYVKKYSPPEKQRVHFEQQLELARELELPVVIHNREADSDTLKILQQHKKLSNGGVMHCFSGDYDFAKKIIELGMLISIPGIVTFKNATTLHEVVKKISLEHMIIETDGPFLSPHPYRGKRNEPVNVLFTAAAVADLKGTTIGEVARVTTMNANRLFHIH